LIRSAKLLRFLKMKSVSGLLFSVVLINFTTGPAIAANDHNKGRSLDKEVKDTIMGKLATSHATEFFERCVDNNDYKTLQNIQAAMNKTKTCLGTILYAQDGASFFTAILLTLMKLDKEDLCKDGVADMEKCIYPSLDSIKACTGSVGGNDFEIVKSAVSGAIRYACHNKGERIKDFLREDGIQCSIEDYGEAILDCFNERSVLFAEMSRNVSIFSKDNCRIHDASNQCIVKTYEECQSSSSSKTMEFVTGVIDAAVEQTPCASKTTASYHKNPKPSPGKATVNGVSSTVLCAIFPIFYIFNHLSI